jgi:hypothetical protein
MDMKMRMGFRGFEGLGPGRLDWIEVEVIIPVVETR